MSRATVWAPASIGNVGPGFDVLGLAIDGLGDKITIELVNGPSSVAAVAGRDAEAIPRDPAQNCAVIAALSVLRRIDDVRGVVLSLERALPVSGGLGASAAASVGGAMAAVLASGKNVGVEIILAAALDGEEAVAGRHLDNIAPCLFGGLTVVRTATPPDTARVPVKGDWWITVVSPSMRLSTKKSRSVLPQLVTRQEFVSQMAHTATLVTAFATGDHELARRSLVDLYAEPRRAPLIPGFTEVKAAALKAGALGCSISGAGPSVFALSADSATAQRVAAAMVPAFVPMKASAHTGCIAAKGAHQL